jgi:glycerol kinase
MRRKFHVDSSRFFGIPDEILPEIKSSATIFGYISKGVLRGIPVGAVKK